MTNPMLSAWWTVHRGTEFVAKCRYAEDAAAVVGLYGEGAVVKANHGRIVWREMHEPTSAADSYDMAADLMRQRCLVDWR